MLYAPKQILDQALVLFNGSKYPGDDNLINGPIRRFDDSEQTYKLYKGKKWQDIKAAKDLTPGDKKYVYSPLGWLTPIAFVYYLPAYICLFIREYCSEWDLGNLAESFEGALTKNRVIANDRFNEILSLLNTNQKKLVSQFCILDIELLNQYHPTKEYLEAREADDLYALMLTNKSNCSMGFNLLNNHWKEYLSDKELDYCWNQGFIEF